jgi:hypothetical protein
MPGTTRKLAKLAGLLLVSAAVAFLSVKIERRGPEFVQFGNLCGATHDQPCMRPSLKGGYPLTFLVDTPGVSVENQLFLGEDQFVPLAFIVDWAICAAALWLLYRVLGWHRQIKPHPRHRE